MKTEPGERLVTCLELIAAGHRVGFDVPFEPPTGLTTREREILELMAVGRTNLEIARSLFVSEETVKTYAKRLFRKLGVRNRVEAAVRAAELGVVA
jgi:DNA-binding NarL/FixJ family response regulator